MPTEVVMPQMGESIAEGTITKWLKNVGDHVERDEPLFEISTDKVDAEIPSPAAGFVGGDVCGSDAPAGGAPFGCAGAADGGAAVRCGVGPDSIKLRMSFLVTRPLMPVPSSCLMSMPCSSAILRTSGLDFVRRNSSAAALPSVVAGFALPASLFRTSGFTSVL